MLNITIPIPKEAVQSLQSGPCLSPGLAKKIMDDCMTTPMPLGKCFVCVTIKSKTKPISLADLLNGIIFSLSPLRTFFQKTISATYLNSDKEEIHISIDVMEKFMDNINDREQEEITGQNEFLNNEKN